MGGRHVLAGTARGDPVPGEVRDRLEDARPTGVADVVVGHPDVVDPGIGQALDELRVGREDRPFGVITEVVGRRVLEVGNRQVRPADQLTHGARIAGPLRPRQVPVERGAAVAGGDLGRPAIEWEVDPLALDLHRLRHAAVEHDVAAGDERPGLRGVEPGAQRLRQASGQAPFGERRDAPAAKERLAAPAERTDAWPDGICPQECQPLAVSREIRG